ncbi:MAG: response regulator, partial [Gluconacetobacter diazotrophicus]|nr:response regulator [Gluconacetobacter diazotrophicus]
MSKPLRIFVVENHRDTLEIMRMYLEMHGHVVLSADSMAGALAALPEADCDVLISDIGLPDGDGWTLLRQLQLPRRIYAVAMSGFGMGSDHLKSQEVGYRHHLLKPLDHKQLDAILEE